VSHDIESSLCGDALFIRRYQSKTASRYHVSQRRNGCNTDSTHIQHHEAFVSENTRGQSKTVRPHCLGFRVWGWGVGFRPELALKEQDTGTIILCASETPQ
jgi:hypothetical protein